MFSKRRGVLSRSNRIRWVARGVGMSIGALWLFIAVCEAAFETPSWTFEAQMMAGLIAGCLVSIVLAWWREGLGGMLLVICSIAHSTFAFFSAGHNKALAVVISGGPFLVIGILFLISWRSATRSRTE